MLLKGFDGNNPIAFSLFALMELCGLGVVPDYRNWMPPLYAQDKYLLPFFLLPTPFFLPLENRSDLRTGNRSRALRDAGEILTYGR